MLQQVKVVPTIIGHRLKFSKVVLVPQRFSTVFKCIWIVRIATIFVIICICPLIMSRCFATDSWASCTKAIRNWECKRVRLAVVISNCWTGYASTMPSVYVNKTNAFHLCPTMTKSEARRICLRTSHHWARKLFLLTVRSASARVLVIIIV